MTELDKVSTSTGNKQILDVAAALQKLNRTSLIEDIQMAEEERNQVIARFPLEDWPALPLERYALGLGVKDSFCWWMEWGTKHLGSIRGGSSEKHLIYNHKTKGWVFDSAYQNEQVAWEAICGAFVNAFELAKQGQFDEIDALEPFKRGYAIVVKVMYVYFPNQFLPIYSADHTAHFLQVLNYPLIGNSLEWRGVRLNRALFEVVQQQPGLKDLSHLEVMRFLYQFYDPRIAQRIVKIAPGEDAKYWKECLAGGYICVQEANWDEIGDLRDYESEESFIEDFVKYNPQYASHTIARKKAQELWMLRELEAGDIIVANEGIAHVLAVGIVKDPGYKWNPERAEAWHTVEVDWNPSVEGEIEPQKRWGSVTVATVSRELYQKIITHKPPTDRIVTKLPPPPVEPSFHEIAEALERKGQVILYGPPGTGKTYTARRFAVWWLRRHNGNDTEALPADPAAFSGAEKNLTTVQMNRRAWWVVANPSRWKWDGIFSNKRGGFSYGRIQRHYPLVQRGDLVIGYQANPDKRVVALAKVSREFGPGEDGQPLQSEDSNLFDLIALLLTEACSILVKGGLQSDYVEREDELPVLRGRLLVDRQLMKHFGRVDHLECHYDEYETDIPENQLLAAALDICSQRVKNDHIRRQVRHHLVAFKQVCDTSTLNLNLVRETLSYTRLNEHYRKAHALAWLVFDGLGIHDLLRAGTTESFVFLIDMNLLFEQFLWRALNTLCRRRNLRVRYQLKNRSILWNGVKNKPYSSIIPDFLIDNPSASSGMKYCLPIDAKYKLYDELKVGNADIYQCFLYAFAYEQPQSKGLPIALLLYPGTRNVPSEHVVEIRDMYRNTIGKVYALSVPIPFFLQEVMNNIQGLVSNRIVERINDALDLA